MLPPCVTTETSLNRGEWRRLCGETLDRPVVRGVIKCLPYWRDETWCKRIWVVSNILSFLHYLGKCSNLIRIFQMGGSSCRQLDDLKNSYGLNMLTSADGKLAGAGGEDFGDKAVDGAVSTRFGSSGDLFWKARYLLVCMKLEQCNMKLQLFWVRPIVSCWDKGIFVRKTNQLEPLRPLRTKHLIYIYIYIFAFFWSGWRRWWGIGQIHLWISRRICRRICVFLNLWSRQSNSHWSPWPLRWTISQVLKD